MIKRIIVLCFFVITCCTACGFGEEKKSSKELMLDFVLENQSEIVAQIENSEEKIMELNGFSGVPGLGDFVHVIDCRVFDQEDQRYLKEGFVYFECEAYGLLHSSVQSGFYYSAEDVPSRNILWADADNWIEVPCEEENTWLYTETEGSDNSLETSRICEGFYYFQIMN